MLAAAALAIGFWLLVFSPRMELLKTQLDHAQQQLDEATEHAEQQNLVITMQAGQLATALVAELKNRELLAQIASQNREHAAALQELKRNDKAITDYLHQPVPAGLGRMYQRIETTDPAAYRSPPSLPADSVRDAGPDDGGHE